MFLVAVARALALTITVIVRVGTPDGPSRVTVMTRNLYLGGDITRPVQAALGRTGEEAVLALGQANHLPDRAGPDRPPDRENDSV